MTAPSCNPPGSSDLTEGTACERQGAIAFRCKAGHVTRTCEECFGTLANSLIDELLADYAGRAKTTPQNFYKRVWTFAAREKHHAIECRTPGCTAFAQPDPVSQPGTEWKAVEGCKIVNLSRIRVSSVANSAGTSPREDSSLPQKVCRDERETGRGATGSGGEKEAVPYLRENTLSYRLRRGSDRKGKRRGEQHQSPQHEPSRSPQNPRSAGSLPVNPHASPRSKASPFTAAVGESPPPEASLYTEAEAARLGMLSPKANPFVPGALGRRPSTPSVVAREDPQVSPVGSPKNSRVSPIGARRGASGSQRKTTQRSRASLDAPPNIAPRDDAQPSPTSLGARQNRAESPTTTAQPEFLSAHEMTLVKRIAEFEAQRAEFDRACQSKETKLRLRELEIEQLHINAERVALEVADHKFELEEVRAELDRATKRLGELRSTLNEEVGDRNGVAGIDSVARSATLEPLETRVERAALLLEDAIELINLDESSSQFNLDTALLQDYANELRGRGAKPAPEAVSFGMPFDWGPRSSASSAGSVWE